MRDLRRSLNKAEIPRTGLALSFLGGLGLGSAIAYFADLGLGRRRRAHVMEKLRHTTRQRRRQLHAVEHDLSNRAHGWAARLRASLRADEAPDEVIEERVRAALGRVCSHPSALDVQAEAGRVTLSGPILEHEYQRVKRAALRVRGVRTVEDFLERHTHPERVPGLQPSLPPTHQPPRLLCADMMKTAVECVREPETLRRAAERMALANVGFLPVCDEERRVIGTVTDRDIVVRGLASGLAADDVPVEQVMSRNPIACAPDDDLSEAERLMAQNQISRLVVTDADGRLLGVISLSDVAMRDRGPALARTLRAVVAREAPAPAH